MKSYTFYILLFLVAMAVASCSDDKADQPAELAWAVRAAWMDGLAGGQSSRALSATDLLADNLSGSDIAIATADYPEEISITCKDKDGNTIDNFTLTNDHESCPLETEPYWSYTPKKTYTDFRIKSGDLKFYATAVIDEDGDPETTDDGDRLEGVAGRNDILHGHLRIQLHHTKALLRFAFKVSEKYDKIRSIVVKGITFNGKESQVKEMVLSKDGMTYVAYIYIDNPETFDLTASNTMVCTYDIYDKDAKFDGSMNATVLATHRTRQDVKARNIFTLTLKDKASNPVTELKPGFYYDLRVTLNPDYLYVLSEYDNKHMTIQ